MTELNLDIPVASPHAYKGEVAITDGQPEIPTVHPSGLAEVVDCMARDLTTIEELKRNGAGDEEVAALQQKVDLRANVLNTLLPFPDETVGWQDVAEKQRLQESQHAAHFAIDEAFRQ